MPSARTLSRSQPQTRGTHGDLDDVTGYALESAPVGASDLVVRIVGALVNALGPAPETESVTLLDTLPAPIDLAGWALADRNKNKLALADVLGAGEAHRIPLAAPVQLSNQCGQLTLLDVAGLQAHGVDDTRVPARRAPTGHGCPPAGATGRSTPGRSSRTA